MEKLVGRVMQIGKGQGGPSTRVKMDTRVRNPKVALRNWRVIMDKIITITVLVELQGRTSEWFMLPPPDLPFYKQEGSSDALEDIY